MNTTMNTQNGRLTTAASEINRHHELANQRADEAVSHAVEAGKLLLSVKSQLKHGNFIVWLQQHVTVSPRQAQRYIACAQGKPTPIRVAAPKTTSVSHLEVVAPRLFAGTPHPAAFTPGAAYCYVCGHAEGPVYLVEPSAKFPGFFFVSRLNTDESYDCTRRPVAAEWVESTLQQYGLSAPADADWKYKSCGGVRAALETLDRVAA